MPGPDLPPPAAPRTKAELVHGVLVFAGGFDERDLETARHTYPGRRPVLNADGAIWKRIRPTLDPPHRS
ncbi:hypothetical protein SAZ_05115 [Streptomyces noursei ZPM]|uniref:Uncharacterized protein n=1 Tax=Streptomyces noursei TaxID=1971 RepID=A0A401QUT3_STRNR|nr:hypothetical protein [Streptomyces noursei]AKA08477.1 hypothetical protein SAZ_05115 [Streptomyces noursei ZPM]EOT01620.1 hypothetical protein K530_22907 [Streptomyces noursei CCRC 11814]EXU87655.1 hypothetical protein P354_34555 [Streptomyces noursei PD-1]UWS70358.1 hypothetical protein N1H47_03385 [Streptomyces noursei]GCB89062.1 hypothetical protein SALB_01735 [Streptomyces noursei]